MLVLAELLSTGVFDKSLNVTESSLYMIVCVQNNVNMRKSCRICPQWYLFVTLLSVCVYVWMSVCLSVYMSVCHVGAGQRQAGSRAERWTCWSCKPLSLALFLCFLTSVYSIYHLHETSKKRIVFWLRKKVPNLVLGASTNILCRLIPTHSTLSIMQVWLMI